jgi:hypothetical protein
MRRTAARTDANHSALVSAFHGCGATVCSLASLGHGCPDLLIGFRGANLLVECKDGAKSKSRIRLTPLQEEFIRTWRGKVHVIDSVDAAINLLRTVKS